MFQSLRKEWKELWVWFEVLSLVHPAGGWLVRVWQVSSLQRHIGHLPPISSFEWPGLWITWISLVWNYQLTLGWVSTNSGKAIQWGSRLQAQLNWEPRSDIGQETWKPLLPSSAPVTPLFWSADHINSAESKMPPKLELGTRENYGRKVGTLLGLWLSWGIPEEEELLRNWVASGSLRPGFDRGGTRKGQADPISRGVAFGTVSRSMTPTSFDLQGRPNGPLRVPWNGRIYLCLYRICRCVWCGFPPLCFFSCTFIIYSARLSLSLTYQAINLKSEKVWEASTFFPLIIRPYASWI